MKPWIIMRKGIRLNRLLEERMIFVVGSGIILGALLHDQIIAFKPFVPYAFAYMTLSIALGSSYRDFIKAFRQPGLYMVIFFCLHVFLPTLATIITGIFLPNYPELRAGVILGTAIPIGVASTIWVNISKGNPAISLTAVILNTVLSPLIVPLVILVTVGTSVHFDVKDLMHGLLLMIVIPTVIGVTLHDLTGGQIKRKVSFFTGPSTKILLAMVIATNMAAAWNSLHLLQSAIPLVMAVTFSISCSGYLLGYFTGKIMRLSTDLINTFIYTVGMRNITAGLVMALNYFPEITAIPVVFAIMFQQPLAALSLRTLVIKDPPPSKAKNHS